MIPFLAGHFKPDLSNFISALILATTKRTNNLSNLKTSGCGFSLPFIILKCNHRRPAHQAWQWRWIGDSEINWMSRYLISPPARNHTLIWRASKWQNGSLRKLIKNWKSSLAGKPFKVWGGGWAGHRPNRANLIEWFVFGEEAGICFVWVFFYFNSYFKPQNYVASFTKKSHKTAEINCFLNKYVFGS